MLTLILIFCSGCVYWRLLQLKWQLGSFDEHVRIERSDGLAFVFKEPLLLAGDMEWLGFLPSEKESAGEFENWNMIFDKQYREASDEPDVYDMSVQMVFKKEKLHSIRLSETYLAIIPADLIISFARSLSGAEVDRKNKSASVTVSFGGGGSQKHPTIGDTRNLLGEPYRETKQDAKTIHRYHYHLKRPKENEREEEKKTVYWVELTFEDESGDLVRTRGDFYGGTIDIAFKPQ